MHPRRAGWAVGLLFAGLAAAPLVATTIKSATIEETIDASEAIVAGTVVTERVERMADGGHMTAVRIRVEEALKGPFGVGDTIVVHALGGEIGGRRQVALGEAVYRRGERVLLQLETVDGRLRTLGLALGKWNLLRDADRDQVLVRNLAGLAVAGDRAALTEGPLGLDEFRGLVLAREGGPQAGGQP